MLKNIASSKLSQSKIEKMMRMAKFIAEDNTSCLGRKVGTVITNKYGVILSTGYNGAPRGLPHCDSYDYLSNFFYPKLTEEEKNKLATIAYKKECKASSFDELVVPSRLDGCGQCPRRLLGYSNGIRSELCYCQHSESNAIIFSQKPLENSFLFCWCDALSCIDCTGKIISSGISEVHFLEGSEFHSGVKCMYNKANIPVFRYPIESFL